MSVKIAAAAALIILCAQSSSFAQSSTDEKSSKWDADAQSQTSTPPFAPASQSTEEDLKKRIEELKGQLDGMDEAVKELQTDRDALKKIKVSGYLQVNFEKSENPKGLATDPYDDGDFVKSRFRLRRSRIKVQYDAGIGNMVVQADYSNSGFSLKDAYLDFTEPWLKMFSLRFGVFNRPAYEVEYSSSQRESPERSRVIQALYPGERDLGVMLTAVPQDLFTLQLAGFNNTIRGTYSQQNPNFGSEPLYFMGRLTKSLSFGDVGLDVGVHGRFGNVRANSGKVFESDVPTNGAPDSTSIMIGDGVSKGWFGVEAQLYYDFLGGMKILAEYITGADVNELTATRSALRKRDFNGFYAMLVKNLGAEFQLALKYDSYTPNASISDDRINLVSELPVSTIGVGLHNYTFANVRLSLWYDMISTKTNDRLLPNDPKDNLLTFRTQYRFP